MWLYFEIDHVAFYRHIDEGTMTAAQINKWLKKIKNDTRL